VNDQLFPRRFTEALRPGTYLRIVVEGDVGAGDEIRVIERPNHDLTVRHVFRIYTRDRHESTGCLRFPECPRAGGAGRMIFFKGQEAVPWTRANRDVADQDFSDLRPSVQDAEFRR